MQKIQLPDELNEFDLELIEDVVLTLAERMIELRREAKAWAERDAEKTDTMFQMIEDQ